MRRMRQIYERKIQPISSNTLLEIIQNKLTACYTQEKYTEWLSGFVKDSELTYEQFLEVNNTNTISTDGKRIAVKINLYTSNIDIPLFKGFFKWLVSDINKYGWYISSPTEEYLEEIKYEIMDIEEKNTTVTYNFLLEPLYGEIIKILPRYIYHISHTYNISRILSKGLIPSSAQKQSNYPNRNYVLFSLNKLDILIDGLISNEFPMFDILYTDVVHSEATNISDYLSLFKIDTAQLNKGTKFFIDNDMPTGAWTYTHIPSKAIKLIDIKEFIK